MKFPSRILFFLTAQVLAAEPQVDFHASAERLKAQRAQTDLLLGRLKTRSGFDEVTGFPGSRAGEKVSPLFQVHDSLIFQRIASGRLLFGKLLNRLVVGSDGSPVLIRLGAQQGSLSGLQMMGMARQGGTAGRIALEVSRLLLHSGSAVTLQGTGLDEAGAYGLEAQVFSSKAWAVAGALASSFISGVAASQQTQVFSPFGTSQTQPTGRNAMLQGVAQTAADQSKRLIDEATAERPILVVEADTSVSVLIQEEVRF